MITIGVDAHKRIHLAVALDDAGRELTQWRGPNSAEGWQQLSGWARQSASHECGASRGRGARIRPIPGHRRRGGVRSQLPLDGPKSPSRSSAGQERPPGCACGGSPCSARDVRLASDSAEDETPILDLLVRERENAMAEATRLRNQVTRY
jgi:hypothetical protein